MTNIIMYMCVDMNSHAMLLFILVLMALAFFY